MRGLFGTIRGYGRGLLGIIRGLLGLLYSDWVRAGRTLSLLTAPLFLPLQATTTPSSRPFNCQPSLKTARAVAGNCGRNWASPQISSLLWWYTSDIHLPVGMAREAGSQNFRLLAIWCRRPKGSCENQGHIWVVSTWWRHKYPSR